MLHKSTIVSGHEQALPVGKSEYIIARNLILELSVIDFQAPYTLRHQSPVPTTRNFSGTLPQTLSLWFVDRVTSSSCIGSDTVTSCYMDKEVCTA